MLVGRYSYMAESGKIFPAFTQIEIDEKGQIWLIQNHFESDSVIMELESSSRGVVIYDEGWVLADEYDDDPMFGEDYL
jgi:hypothetical protein